MVSERSKWRNWLSCTTSAISPSQNAPTDSAEEAFSQALSLDGHVDVTAVRLFLIQFREDAGSPHDAVERVLVDQLAMVHLKIAEMYSLAAATSDL